MILFQGTEVNIVELGFAPVSVILETAAHPVVTQCKIEAKDGSWSDYVRPSELTFIGDTK